jgi:hypothetical protein
MPTHSMPTRAATTGVFLATALALAACSQQVKIQGSADPGAVNGPAAEQPLPDYGEVARLYNERIAPIQSLYSAGTVRLTYFDENRDKKEEQGDATLQVQLPDRLALSLKKAGKRLFWLGGDDQRYWWFDLVNNRPAMVGLHEHFDLRARDQIGLGIHPLDLIRVLGILPLPERKGDDAVEPGATQWSDDGRLLGVVTAIRDGGFQRLWLDPQRLEAQKIELFDAGRNLVVVADLQQYDFMPIAGIGGGGPRIAQRISVLDVASGTDVRLTMGAPEGGADRIHQDAFDFNALRNALGVSEVIDLDAPPRAAADGAPPAGADK